MNETKEAQKEPTPQTFRVTRNIIKNNRLDICPWMYRNSADSIQDAVQVKRVYCKDVKFERSRTDEADHGCHLVAEVAEVDVETDVLPTGSWREIIYHCGYMVFNGSLLPCHSAKEMLLLEDKTMRVLVE